MRILLSYFLKNTPLKVLLFSAMISLPFYGSDCNNNNIISGGKVSGNITGTWKLTYMTGYLQDVCYGEVVNFQSDNLAILQCPGETPLRRTYSVSNNVLTYTTTGVQYRITTLTNTTLVLEGMNNLARTLTYTKQPTDHMESSTEVSHFGKNSSDN